MIITEEVKNRFGKFFIALAQISNLKIEQSNMDVFSKFENQIRNSWDLGTLLEQTNISANRDFLRKIGVDPTKLRPSGEALIRRTLKKGMPKINNIVDAGNFGSVLTGISTSVYDADIIKGDIVVRFAKIGEEYVPWGEDRAMTLKGDEVVIVDGEKIMALYPYRDSKFCVIQDNTKNVLFQAHGVPGISKDDVKRSVEIMLNYLNFNSKINEIQIIE